MTKFTPLDPYIPWNEASQTLGICRKTLGRYAAEPDAGIRSIMVGGRRLFRRDDLAAWIAKRERQAPTRRSA